MAPVVEKRREEIFLVSKSGQRDYDSFMREVEKSLKVLQTLNPFQLPPVPPAMPPLQDNIMPAKFGNQVKDAISLFHAYSNHSYKIQ